MFPNMQTDNPSAEARVMAAVVPGEQVARQRTITQGSGYSGPGSSRGQEVGTRGHTYHLLELQTNHRQSTIMEKAPKAESKTYNLF